MVQVCCWAGCPGDTPRLGLLFACCIQGGLRMFGGIRRMAGIYMFMAGTCPLSFFECSFLLVEKTIFGPCVLCFRRKCFTTNRKLNPHT